MCRSQSSISSRKSRMTWTSMDSLSDWDAPPRQANKEKGSASESVACFSTFSCGGFALLDGSPDGWDPGASGAVSLVVASAAMSTSFALVEESGKSFPRRGGDGRPLQHL